MISWKRVFAALCIVLVAVLFSPVFFGSIAAIAVVITKIAGPLLLALLPIGIFLLFSYAAFGE